MALCVCGTLCAASDDPPPVARLVYIDGTTEPVSRLDPANDQELRLAGDRTVPADDLRAIEPLALPAAAQPAGIEVHLVRGGRILADAVTLTGDVCTAVRDGASWRIALDDLRAVVLDPQAAAGPLVAALAGPPAQRDLLLARLGEGVTSIDGFVESLTDDAVSFDWMNEARRLPREKLCGIVFARVPGAAAETAPRFTVELADGSRLPADSVALAQTDQGLAVRADLSPATSLDVPWSTVRRIAVRSGRVQFVSDLAPLEARDRPIIALPRSWQADRSVTGAPLMAGSETFEKGLGVQSGSALGYGLAGQWSDFAALLALDPRTGTGGDCVFVVMGDGRELLRQPLRGADPPHPVRVDVTGVQRLELVVEHGGDLDFGDHANWCDARLVRAAAMAP